MIEYLTGFVVLSVTMILVYGMIAITEDEQKKWEERRKNNEQ